LLLRNVLFDKVNRYCRDRWLFVPTHHRLGGLGLGLILRAFLKEGLLLRLGVDLLGLDVICYVCRRYVIMGEQGT